mmetsp:Transcript_20341/g.42426  ORF Transcript_20341/g.42426 Transcript_20341/m.42426 type:complete len:471 (+) Transcript_20341:997-2409(+)
MERRLGGHLRVLRDRQDQGQGRHEGPADDRRLSRRPDLRPVHRGQEGVQPHLPGPRRALEDHRGHRGRAHDFLGRRDEVGRDPPAGGQVDPLRGGGRRRGGHRGCHRVPAGQEVLQEGLEGRPGRLHHRRRPERDDGRPGQVPGHRRRRRRRRVRRDRGVQARREQQQQRKPRDGRHGEIQQPQHGRKDRRRCRRCDGRGGCRGRRGRCRPRRPEPQPEEGRLPVGPRPVPGRRRRRTEGRTQRRVAVDLRRGRAGRSHRPGQPVGAADHRRLFRGTDGRKVPPQQRRQDQQDPLHRRRRELGRRGTDEGKQGTGDRVVGRHPVGQDPIRKRVRAGARAMQRKARQGGASVSKGQRSSRGVAACAPDTHSRHATEAHQGTRGDTRVSFGVTCRVRGCETHRVCAPHRAEREPSLTIAIVREGRLDPACLFVAGTGQPPKRGARAPEEIQRSEGGASFFCFPTIWLVSAVF